MSKHLFREELSEDQFRERKKDFIVDGIMNGAHLLCRRAGLPITSWAGRLILNLDACWCPEPHLISTESDCPSNERMRVKDKSVYCPIHDNHFGTRQLIDMLPLGRRKTTAKTDELLALVNWTPAPDRFYAFRSGEGFNETMALNADPIEALAEVHPSPKQTLSGVVLEVAGKKRAREVLETKSAELPWRTGLHGMLRADLALPPSWHGARLSIQEERMQREQDLETVEAERAARKKLVEQLRRDIDSTVISPL